MNPSADEETLSAAEVTETNQVTVATVTITSTTEYTNCGWCWSMLYTFIYWICSTASPI